MGSTRNRPESERLVHLVTASKEQLPVLTGSRLLREKCSPLPGVDTGG